MHGGKTGKVLLSIIAGPFNNDDNQSQCYSGRMAKINYKLMRVTGL